MPSGSRDYFRLAFSHMTTSSESPHKSWADALTGTYPHAPLSEIAAPQPGRTFGGDSHGMLGELEFGIVPLEDKFSFPARIHTRCLLGYRAQRQR